MVRGKSNSFLFRLLFVLALTILVQAQDQGVGCPKKKNNVIVPVLASVGGLLGIQLIIALVFWSLNSRRREVTNEPNGALGSLEERRRFTYSEIMHITNNFERIIGRGALGTVYHAYIDDIQVAVKMFSQSSLGGSNSYHQFEDEVRILLRIHHRNLASIVGYCNEAPNLAIIVEYIPNGNLEEHLSENSSTILTWEYRLRIAIDAAQGLEYLHDGCIPQIIHRDVKPRKIILTENFRAKLSGFGLAKVMPDDDISHTSTDVAGTPGYLDPEYYTSNRLTTKNDVYSFGVVLLMIITGRPVISRSDEFVHISQLVSSRIEEEDVRSIVDPALNGAFLTESAEKAIELARSCLSLSSYTRPNMSQVVKGLKECLEAVSTRTDDQDSFETVSVTSDI